MLWLLKKIEFLMHFCRKDVNLAHGQIRTNSLVFRLLLLFLFSLNFDVVGDFINVEVID